MAEEKDKDGICIGDYSFDAEYLDVFVRRAIGQLPEMESAKAASKILSTIVSQHDNILDVGCGVGHYYRSYKNRLGSSFTYTGLDYFEEFIEKAIEVWKEDENAQFISGSIHEMPLKDKEFEIVVCTNLMMHLTNIVDPLKELLRVANKYVVIRTTIDQRSWVVKEVFNNEWYKHTEVRPEQEFNDNGEPVTFSLHNTYSEKYFSSVIRRFCPEASIEYITDTNFDINNIVSSHSKEGRPNATNIFDGRQIYGDFMFLPYKFVVIEKDG